jgi:hypothetical protein
VDWLAFSKKRFRLLVEYFCPLPTTSAPEGAVVRLAARARAAKFIRTLKTFMMVIVQWPACVGVERTSKRDNRSIYDGQGFQSSEKGEIGNEWTAFLLQGTSPAK